MRNIMSMFPTETLLLHKQNGSIIEVTALVDRESIFCDAVNVVVEDGDIYERTLPNGIKEYFRVLDSGFYKGQGDIPDNYQSKVEKISESIVVQSLNKITEELQPLKIFISHSSNDSDYIDALVNLFEAIGLHEDEIICSSIPPYCIPLDNNVYAWLVNEFQHSNLHIIYALSSNYYSSPASLNEMGAAWALKHKWTGILLPGFSFSDVAGCIDPMQIQIKLDENKTILFHRLNELKDNLVSEFGLRPISPTLWERKRDAFMDKIISVSNKRAKKEDE